VLDGTNGRSQRIIGGEEGRMVPEVEDGLPDHVAQVVEVHDHAERVERRAADRHIQMIRMAVQPRALARMPRNAMRRVKDITRGEIHKSLEILA